MTRKNPSAAAPRDPRDFLPLKPDVFLILTILAEGERHGYAIMQAAEDWREGGMEIQAGALYRRLKWMMEERLITEVAGGTGPETSDERRRSYRVTDFGRRVAGAEARRMGSLLAAARDAELVAEGEAR